MGRKDNMRGRKYKKNVSKTKNSYRYEKDIFKIGFSNDGPQDQLVYILRFPTTYKNFQLINKRGDFLNYFDWMGQVREYSLRPVSQKINKLIQGRQWGLATNSVSLKVFDLLRVDDTLEVRLWLDKIAGLENVYHLSFDWLRFLGANSYERIALSNIVVSCVKILGYGKAVITKPPEFLRVFFDNMKPRSATRKPLSTYKTLFGNIYSGKKIRDFGSGPLLKFKSIYQTSLEHSNLVGNVYFSNYSKWINSTKDLFLFENVPNLFDLGQTCGEFITLECEVSHLQEAMPFDKILVKMYLSELYERKVILRYEVFRVEDEVNVKLAVFCQTIVFVGFEKSILKIKDIPTEVLNKFVN